MLPIAGGEGAADAVGGGVDGAEFPVCGALPATRVMIPLGSIFLTVPVPVPVPASRM